MSLAARLPMRTTILISSILVAGVAQAEPPATLHGYVSDPIGVVRMKFLKHPGAELEEIATKYALQTKFEPARNAAGQPIRSRLVWGIEWPSWYWLIYRTGTATEVPPSMGYVPCEGSGPVNLDMGNREGTNSAVYRDCSTPNLSRAAHEPWINTSSR